MARDPQIKDEFSAMVRNISGLLGSSRSSIIGSVLQSVMAGTCPAKDAIELISREMKKHTENQVALDPDSPYDWALIGVYGGPDQIRGVAAAARKRPVKPAAPSPWQPQ